MSDPATAILLLVAGVKLVQKIGRDRAKQAEEQEEQERIRRTLRERDEQSAERRRTREAARREGRLCPRCEETILTYGEDLCGPCRYDGS